MDEQEWLACDDPAAMLECVQNTGQLSDRKARLFAAAVCRRIWPLLTDPRSQAAVEFAEWYADGEIDEEDARQASNEAYLAWEDAASIPADPGEPPDKVLYGSSRLWRQRPYEDDPVARRYLSPHRGVALFHAAYAAFILTASVAERVVADAQEAVWFGTDEGQRSAVARECQAQAGLLRDLVGPLPFRPVSLYPAWRTPAVLALATAVYDNRILAAGTLEPGRLAVLADALEDAGCDNAEILSHLRGDGPHWRGCWAIDLALGKE